ncbi:crocetin glucosyltransferase, chloroplastic-like [Diospyros lotus]|uniref:crocetin glucosyltransferase, chloroplastic-like n=1 Tax=Diospyros lotus TaxID=55363 RepID=UPI00225845CB|nr:crocetin glucosyltransferase, chloroplastic-like [Diospyros lotus]
MDELRLAGSKSLAELITTLAADGSRVSFLIYSLILGWAAAVARDMRVPSAYLSVQSATCFAIYHRFFNSSNGLCHGGTADIDPSISIKLAGMPLISSNDIPTFLLPNSPHNYVIKAIQEHIETLEDDPNPCVLVNTFDALKEDAIRAVDSMNLIAIGPLVPVLFSDEEREISDSSMRIDLFEQSREYLDWLNSKPDSSAIYVSFGSLVALQQKQTEEIFRALVASHRPFLWVIRSSEYGREVKDMIEPELSEETGLIVPWCSQTDVLRHRSIQCFVTHCGWNSAVESLVAGVPVVACPQFLDQTTNAKAVEEVWGTGVRAAANGEGVVEREEMKRCLEAVMGSGERGEEIRRNALKWKQLAMGAVKSGGSSHSNLNHFLSTLP